MVLELHIPELKDKFTDSDVWNALFSLLPKHFAYLMNFVVVAILWLNHHSLFDKIPHSTSKLVWYNTFLLFAMSLIHLPTAFLEKHPLLPQASAFYGFLMFLNAFAFFLIRRYVEVNSKLIPLNKYIQQSNLISTLLYLVSAPIAFVSVYISYMIFIGIPIWHFLPDRFHKRSI